MQITFAARGRRAGAIGITYAIGQFLGEGETLEACADDARTKAYAAGFEHITLVKGTVAADGKVTFAHDVTTGDPPLPITRHTKKDLQKAARLPSPHAKAVMAAHSESHVVSMGDDAWQAAWCKGEAEKWLCVVLTPRQNILQHETRTLKECDEWSRTQRETGLGVRVLLHPVKVVPR